MDRETARQLLEAERSSTEELIETERALAAVEDTDLDSGTDTADREQAMTLLLMAELHHADIEDALDRVATGRYGRCESCGGAIGDERLEARPEARFCMAHERAWERRPPGPEPTDPGWAELDQLPDDLDDDGESTEAAEEAALHVVDAP